MPKFVVGAPVRKPEYWKCQHQDCILRGLDCFHLIIPVLGIFSVGRRVLEFMLHLIICSRHVRVSDFVSRGNMGQITQFRGWVPNAILNVESPTASIEVSRTSQQTHLRRYVETVLLILRWGRFCSTTFHVQMLYIRKLRLYIYVV